MRRALIALSIVLVSLTLSLLIAEAIARFMGYEPWRYVIVRDEPTLHEFDPVLGWRNKQGTYTIRPYSPSGSEIHVNLLSRGRRRTHEHQDEGPDTRPKIVFVGGSFTQGWAISDPETHPWKIQEAFPDYEVLNYGTGGYGTFQSLLTLERELPEMHGPRVVVCGLIEHDEMRNVAPYHWLEILSRFSRRAHVDLPYATLGPDGSLVRHAPERFPSWPLQEHSALVTLTERAFMAAKTRAREAEGRAVTEKVLQEMQHLCAKHGAALIVVLLNGGEEFRVHYTGFLKDSGIASCDCDIPITSDLMVEGEGHPNGRMNTLWADCIAAGLRALPPVVAAR